MANDILVKRIYKEWIKFKKYRSNDQTVSIQFIQFLNDKKILDRKISFNEKNDFECSLNSDDLGINVNFCDNSIVPGTALYKCADLFVAEIVRIGEINNESHSVVKECIEKKSVQIQNNSSVDESIVEPVNKSDNSLSGANTEEVNDVNKVLYSYFLNYFKIASHERIEDIDITDEDFDRIVAFFKSILGESVSIRKIKRPNGFTYCYIDIPSLNITVGSCSSKRDNVKRALKKLLSKIYEGINSETKQQIKKSSNNACDVEEMMFKSYKCICSLLKEYSFDLNNTNETFTNEICHRIEEDLNLILPHKITGKTDKSNKHYSVSSADLGAHGTSNSGCRSLDANMHTAYRKFVKDIISKATKTNSPNNPPVSKKQNTVKKESKPANTKVSATETKSKKIAVNDDVDFYRNLVKKEWFKFKSGKNGFKEPYQFIKHLNSIKLLPHSIIVNEISAIECEIHSVDLEMNVNFRNPSISKGTGPDHASHTFIRKLHELTAK